MKKKTAFRGGAGKRGGEKGQKPEEPKGVPADVRDERYRTSSIGGKVTHESVVYSRKKKVGDRELVSGVGCANGTKVMCGSTERNIEARFRQEIWRVGGSLSKNVGEKSWYSPASPGTRSDSWSRRNMSLCRPQAREEEGGASDSERRFSKKSGRRLGGA